MKRKNIFPLLAGIFLIYLLCRFTYHGVNQEGFLEGQTNSCSEAGQKAYKAWKECYDAYSDVCSKGEAYKKYGFCKVKDNIPCGELNRQFTFNHENLCSKLAENKLKTIKKFKDIISK